MAESVIFISKNLQDTIDGIGGLDTRMRRQGSAVFRRFITDIFNDIIVRSPVDKSFYRNDWELHLGSGAGDIISQVGITNNMPYATVMETGSTPGEKPWPSVGPKTVVADGKIWSNQMPEPVAGGAIDDADWEGLMRQLSAIVLHGR